VTAAKATAAILTIMFVVLAGSAHAEGTPSDSDLLEVDLDQPDVSPVLPVPTQVVPAESPQPPALTRFWAGAGLKWTPPTTFDKYALGVTLMLEVVDISMTLNFLGRPNEYPMGELNPAAAFLFGKNPSGGRVVAVGLAGMALTTALWYVLPDPLRKEVTLTIGVFEGYNAVDMYAAGIRFSLP